MSEIWPLTHCADDVIWGQRLRSSEHEVEQWYQQNHVITPLLKNKLIRKK